MPQGKTDLNGAPRASVIASLAGRLAFRTAPARERLAENSASEFRQVISEAIFQNFGKSFPRRFAFGTAPKFRILSSSVSFITHGGAAHPSRASAFGLGRRGAIRLWGGGAPTPHSIVKCVMKDTLP